MREGIDNIMDKKYHDAIQRFNVIISIKKDHWQSFYLRGLAKLSLGDKIGALLDFEKGININPYFSEFYLYKGMVEIDGGNFASADSLYTKAVELDPSNPFAYLKRSELLMSQNKPSQAIELIDKAIANSPKYGDAYLYKAFCLSETKEYDKALELFGKAIEVNSFDERVFTWRGRLYFELKEYTKALADFNVSLLINENDPLVYFFRSLVHYENGNYDLCIEDLNQVIERNPSNAYAYFNRALINTEMGKFDNAIKDYKSMIDLEPNYLFAYFNMGIVYMEMKQFDKAIEANNKCIEIFSDFYFAYINRSVAKHELGDFGGAFIDRKQAEKIKDQFEKTEYADSAKFTELAKLDLNFMQESLEERFSLKSLKKSNSSDIAFGFFFFSFECPYTNNYYIAEELVLKNKYGMRLSLNIADSCIYSDTAINNSNAQALLRSLLLVKKDNYNTALTIIDSLLAITPNAVELYVNRAWIRTKMIDFMKSLDSYPQNTTVTSNTFNVTTNFTDTDKIKTYDDYYIVLNDYKKALAISPDNPYILYNIGNTHLSLFNYPEAIASFKKAIEKNKELGEAYFNLGLTYIYISDKSNACNNLSKCGELGIKQAYTLLKKYCNNK